MGLLEEPQPKIPPCRSAPFLLPSVLTLSKMNNGASEKAVLTAAQSPGAGFEHVAAFYTQVSSRKLQDC